MHSTADIFRKIYIVKVIYSPRLERTHIGVPITTIRRIGFARLKGLQKNSPYQVRMVVYHVCQSTNIRHWKRDF